jgi:hypothetical protein
MKYIVLVKIIYSSDIIGSINGLYTGDYIIIANFELLCFIAK